MYALFNYKVQCSIVSIHLHAMKKNKCRNCSLILSLQFIHLVEMSLETIFRNSFNFVRDVKLKSFQTMSQTRFHGICFEMKIEKLTKNQSCIGNNKWPIFAIVPKKNLNLNLLLILLKTHQHLENSSIYWYSKNVC